MSEAAETLLPRPEVVEKYLLKVLDETKFLENLTVDQFRKLLPLNALGIDDDGVELKEVVPGTGWTQSLSFSSAASGKFGIEYWFDHQSLHSDALNADLTPICGMSFGSYRSQLMAIGFEEGPSMPDGRDYEQRGTLSHTFIRGDAAVDILSQGEVAAGGEGQGACILKVEIRLI